jgi:hypothetical protein
MTVQQTSAGLSELSQNLSSVTQNVNILSNAVQQLSQLADAGGFQKYQQTLLDLTRSLGTTRGEMDSVAKSIDNLAKSTQYYSKSTLAEMVANFQKGTTALSSYRAEHEKLAAAMAGTFKQGADRYAASLAELAKTMPDLTRKINSGAKDFSTFNDILRKGGVDALVAYKAAIGDLNSEMKKLDKSTDILSKLKKEAADLQMNVGDVVSNNLGVAGVGAAGYFLGNKLGGAGGALLSRGLPGVAGLALGKELSNSSDYGSAGQYVGNIAQIAGAGSLGSLLGPLGTTLLGSYGASLGPLGIAGGVAVGSALSIRNSISRHLDEGGSLSDLFTRSHISRMGVQTAKDVNAEQERIRVQGLDNEFGSWAANNVRGSFKGTINSSDYYANESQALLTEAAGREKFIADIRAREAAGGTISGAERDYMNKAQKDQLTFYGLAQQTAAKSTAGAMSSYTSAGADISYLLATNPGGISKAQGESFAGSGTDVIRRLQAELAIAQKDNSVEGQQNQARITSQLRQMQLAQGNRSTIYEQGQLQNAGLNIAQLGITQQTAQFGGASYSVLNQNSQAIAAEYDKVAEMSKLEAKKLQDLGLEVEARNKLREAAQAELAADKARAESAQRTLQLQQFATSLRIEARGLTTKGTGLYSQSANIDDQIKQLIDEKYTAGTTSERRASIDKEISSLQQQQKFNSTQLMLGQTEQTGIELQGRFSAVGSLGAYEQSSILKNRIDYLQQELELQKQLDPLQRRKIAFEKERTETELKISQIQEKLQTTTFQQGINDINLQAAQITRNPFIASKFVKQGIELSKERLGGLNEQLAEAQKSGNQTAVQSLQTQIAQEQLKVLQSIDFQRRSFAEQFTATSFGMAQGSYLFSGQPSQYSVLGSGYYEGISANGPKDGTYQTQIAQMFGEGADERTPIEHLFNTIINGVNFKDGATFKINLEGWDGQSPLNAVKVPTP